MVGGARRTEQGDTGSADHRLPHLGTRWATRPPYAEGLQLVVRDSPLRLIVGRRQVGGAKWAVPGGRCPPYGTSVLATFCDARRDRGNPCGFGAISRRPSPGPLPQRGKPSPRPSPGSRGSWPSPRPSPEGRGGRRTRQLAECRRSETQLDLASFFCVKADRFTITPSRK